MVEPRAVAAQYSWKCIRSYLIEEVESVDVILMENKFNELTSAVQVDGLELT